MSKQEPIYSFYVLKAICAFLVVACHVPTWFDGSPLLDLAVPIFFMITGYFLHSGGGGYNPSKTKVLKPIKQAFTLLVVLTIVYYFIQPAPFEYQGLPILVRWLFVSIPTRYGGPLWYLTALFWGLIFFNLYMYQTKGRYVWVLILLTLLGLAIGKYRFLFAGEKSSYFVLNFVNYALPCFAIGYLIRQYEVVLTRWRFLLEAVIVVFLLFTLELALLAQYSQGLSTLGPSIFVYPMCALILMVACKYKHIGKGGLLVTIGRDYAGNIYYWHMLFVALLARLFGVQNGEEMELLPAPYWIILVFVLSLVFSKFVVLVQKRLGISLFK